MDGSWFRSINRFARHTAWAHGVMRWFATTGIALFAVLLVASFLVSRHRRDQRGVAGIISTGVSVLVALGLGQILGHLVGRLRPYHVMTGVQVLVHRTSDFSFPSDHATAVGAVAIGLWCIHRRLGTIACTAAVVMAVARVYVGAHYPGDVVAGLALGGVVAYAGHRLLTPLLARIVRPIAASKLGWLVGARR